MQEEFRFRVRQHIRNLPFCPRTEWVSASLVSFPDTIPLNSPSFPPVWKLGKLKNLKMIYQLHRPPIRSSGCHHCHRIVDHHLSMGLSSAIYRVMNPPWGEETTREITQARMEKKERMSSGKRKQKKQRDYYNKVEQSEKYQGYLQKRKESQCSCKNKKSISILL